MSFDTNIESKAIGSIKWATLIEIVSKVFPSVIMIILAQLLIPEDFGVVATALALTSFIQLIWDAGLGRVLIQMDEVVQDLADIIFWSNLVLGLFAYVLLYLSAPFLVEFLNNPTSTIGIFRVLGIQTILGSLSSVPQSILSREFGFKKLFWVKLPVTILPGIFSITLALIGKGVWALVIGNLVGSTVNLIMLWRFVDWRPRLTVRTELISKVYRFGFWVIAESLAIWFFTWGDNLVVGKYLGVFELGVYRMGWSITSFVYGLVLNPMIPILYASFSRMQKSFDEAKLYFSKINRGVISISFPLGLLFYMLSPSVVKIVFNEQWIGLGFVISVLGFMNGLVWMVGINAEFFRAVGRPDVNSKLMFIAILYYFPAYLITAPMGLEVFTYARAALGVISILVHIYFMKRTFNFSVFYLWHQGKEVFIASIGFGLCLYVGVNSFLESPSGFLGFVQISLVASLSTLCYIIVLWIQDRKFISNIVAILNRAFFQKYE